MINKIFKILSGKVLTQVVLLFAYPVLSTIYTPAEFGSYAYSLSIIVIIGSLLSMQLHTLFPNARAENKRDTYLTSSIYINIINFILISPLFFFIDHENILLIVIAVLFFSLNEIFKADLLSRESYWKSSIALVFGKLSSISLKFFGKLSLWLIVSDIVGYIISSLYTLSKTESVKLISRKIFFDVIKSNYKYMFIHSASVLILISVNEIPVLSLKSLYNESDVGLFHLSYKLMVTPFVLIGASLSTVFHNELVKKKFKIGLMLPLLLLLTYFLFLYFVNTYAGLIFSMLFSQEWVAVVPLVITLSKLSLFKILLGPAYAVFLANRKVFYNLLILIVEISLLSFLYYLSIEAKLSFDEYVDYYVHIVLFSDFFVLISACLIYLRSSDKF